MLAASFAERLPAVRPGEDLLSAVRLVVAYGLPGLVVADERGEVVRCLASTDLLRLLLPRYVWDEPGLARTFDEEHADRIATALVGTPLGDVVGDRAAWIPNARAQATIVELTEHMVRWRTPIVLVEREQGGVLGVVTANRVLEMLLAGTGGRPR
jgi:hypothetical protein